MGKPRKDYTITIDVRDYLDDMLDEVLDSVDARYVRDALQDARRCLNRPERSVAEAIEYIERGLGVINKALRGSGQ